MRGKLHQMKADEYQHARDQFDTKEKRLDLNDLLQRVKEEKKVDKKYNLLILSGTAFIVFVFALFLSI
tara:strand:+ start:657 stop:860 length:204 start_codon:yes stop_codon:yes gene_type:complete